MNVVFLCGGYYPDFSATGNCVYRLAEECVKRGLRTYIICKNTKDIEKKETVCNQNIIRVKSRKISQLSNISKRSKIAKFYYKMKWHLYMLFQKDGLDSELVDAYQQELNLLNENMHIDALLPCCMPAESIKASYLFCTKHQDVKLFPLLYDLYSENKDFLGGKLFRFLKRTHTRDIEEKCFSIAQKSFFIDNWESYFAQHQHDNAERVEHPLVVYRAPNPLTLKDKTDINLIYQGVVNYQMRPPTIMLKYIVDILSLNKNVSLHVFASGNAVNEFENAAKKEPRILFYGRVDKLEADRYYDDSDISVIIGNRDKNIVPSKIFECVASGRPIIYFYYTEFEKSFKLLKKYPLVFFVKQAHYDNQIINQLNSWVIENSSKRVSFDIVQKIYDDAVPDYIVNEIEKFSTKTIA